MTQLRLPMTPEDLLGRAVDEVIFEPMTKGELVRDGDGDGWVYDGTPQMRRVEVRRIGDTLRSIAGLHTPDAQKEKKYLQERSRNLREARVEEGFVQRRNDTKAESANYVPLGRTDQASHDYTDFPQQLADRFSRQQLTDALEDGVLKFDYEEHVPMRAIQEALKLVRKGTDDPEPEPEEEESGDPEVPIGEGTMGATIDIIEKQAEQRITTGVLYAPDALDFHDEWVEADDIEKAVHRYMERGDFDIRRQHGEEAIGKTVGVMVWPYETEVAFKKAGDGKETRKVTLPAGTAYVSVKWSKDAWEDVKKDKIRGLSMGGAAVRVKDATKEGLKKFT